MNELRLLLNDAIGKNLNKGSKLYQAYHDKIWERYGFASILKTNQYNYLFGLLTGTSAYKNSAGNASWAREELIRAFFDANLAGYIASMAMDGVTHVSTVKIKNPRVTDSEAVVPKGTGNALVKDTGSIAENTRNLRTWAKNKGWEQQNTAGGVEQWGVKNADGTFSWRLKLKPEVSTREGLGAGSNQPRFDARLDDKGTYINPFTGETGGRGIGTHIPLGE